MANNAFATTGLRPYSIGDNLLFQISPFKNGLPWDLTMGQATLLLSDPNGNNYSFPGSISAGQITYPWTVVGPVGTWTRAWKLKDASGIQEIQNATAFTVASSPA
jgi:hypothetical protein